VFPDSRNPESCERPGSIVLSLSEIFAESTDTPERIDTPESIEDGISGRRHRRRAGKGSSKEDVGRGAKDPELVVDPVVSPFPWPEEATTVMVRNIPNRYTAEELLADMLSAGIEGTFDFLYLPMDFRTKRNRGYGFINFLNVSAAEEFVHAFHGMKLQRYTTSKVVAVSPALTQGLDANIAQYTRKDAQRIQNPWFRPLIFKGGELA